MGKKEHLYIHQRVAKAESFPGTQIGSEKNRLSWLFFTAESVAHRHLTSLSEFNPFFGLASTTYELRYLVISRGPSRIPSSN